MTVRIAIVFGVAAICAHTAFAQPGTDELPAPAPPAVPPPEASSSQNADVPAALPAAGLAVPPPPAAAPSSAVAVLPTKPEHRDRYPVEFVDRPLVHPAGMTVFDPSYQFRTHVERYTDASGVVRYRRTGFADDMTPDLSVSHAFGPVDVGVGLGVLARVHASTAIPTLPVAIGVGAGFGAPQPDRRYYHSQYIRIVYKRVLVPQRVALFGSATADLAEARLFDAMDMLVEGIEVSGSGGVSVELQLSRHWCVVGRVNGGVPLYKTAAFDVHAGLGTGASVLLGFRKWDFFVDADLGDVTRRPSTFLNIGFAKRWGL